MPCRQFSTYEGRTGSGRAGGGGYRTEAECLNACREGACCEGSTCSVKPQCQCQGADKRFQGIGTVCSADTCQFCNANGFPKTGSGVSRCYCYCTVNGGTIPQFINITINWSFSSTVTPYGSTTPQPNPSCTRSGSITATLTKVIRGPYADCSAYELRTADYWLQAFFGLSLEGAEYGRVLGFIDVCETGFGPPFNKITMGAGINETFLDSLTRDTGLGVGMCFSRFIGLSQSNASSQNACDALPGWSCSNTSQVTINGFQ